MNLQRREEIRAIAREFRRLFLHEQAEAIDELLAHIATLEQAAAERVIGDGSRGPTPGHAGESSAWVPPTPVTDAALVEVRSWIHAVGPVGAMVWVDPQEVLKVAGVRVLGEGMIQIDAKIFAKSVDDLNCLVNCAAMNHWDGELMRDAYAAIDALRANQGANNAN